MKDTTTLKIALISNISERKRFLAVLLSNVDQLLVDSKYDIAITLVCQCASVQSAIDSMIGMIEALDAFTE